jgi:hypothetical protein
LCLGHPEADLPQELSLRFDERLQFDEQCVGQVGRGREPDASPAAGAGVGIEDIDGCGRGCSGSR